MVEDLDAVFHALSSEPRRAMLDALTTGERTVGDLAAPFEMSLAGVSKHLKVLEGAGLVQRRTEGRTTICTLRAAIQEANALAGADTIDFAVGITAINITSQYGINSAITINGAGVTVANTGTSRLYNVTGGAVAVINGLTITGGNPAADGGAVLRRLAGADGDQVEAQIERQALDRCGERGGGEGHGREPRRALTMRWLRVSVRPPPSRKAM